MNRKLKIRIVMDMADSSGRSNVSMYGRLHGERCDTFQSCVQIRKNCRNIHVECIGIWWQASLADYITNRPLSADGLQDVSQV